MNINNNPSTIAGFDPGSLQTTLSEVKKTATESITKALTLLTTVDATGVLPPKDGVMQLAPPKMNLSAADLTLRIGLLQDALNELMQSVSKNEIQGRLNDLNRDNREQLDKMKDQMEHLEKEAAKKREADKKVNIFQAIANFFKAIFDFISAVFTAIAAIGYALTGNVVAAAGLFAATAALLAASVINMVMAVDSVMKAAGGGGFLSDKAIAGMVKATEILGYVAMGAAMVGGLGAVVEAVQTGSKLATTQLANLGMKESAKEVLMNATKEAFTELASKVPTKAMQEAAEETAKKLMYEAVKNCLKTSTTAEMKEIAKKVIQEAVKESIKSSMQLMMQMLGRQAVTSGIIQGSAQITQGVAGVLVADIREDAAAERRKADEAEAQAKAIQAMIEMLRKTIEQLQDDLQKMLESAMETISAIFNAADETASSMKDLMHFQAA